MFKEYYTFTKNPFDKNFISEKDAFYSKDHREATSRLTFLKNIRGVGVLTSAPGFGKTYALRCFVKSIDRNLHEVAYVCLSTISVTEFYRQFCAALGIDAPYGKSAMFKAVQDRLFHLFKEKKKPFILILDEAQELSSAILKDLKMIMNHDFDSTDCFTLALAGEPYLNHILEKPIHEALRHKQTTNERSELCRSLSFFTRGLLYTTTFPVFLTSRRSSMCCISSGLPVRRSLFWARAPSPPSLATPAVAPAFSTI
jgi:type II secretory pathway predicted ATPase ExeA